VNTPAKEIVVPTKKTVIPPGGRLLMDVTADAFHADADGGFLADGNVTIDSGEFIIETDSVRVTRKKDGGPAVIPPSTPDNGAKADWIFPKIDFREATLREVADYLVVKSRQLDPKGKGVNIVLRNGRALDEAKITLSLVNVPLQEVLKYVAALANAEAVEEEFAYVLRPKAAAGEATASTTPKPEPKPIPAAAAKEKGAAWKKAETIILERIDFRSASLEESIDFLRAKAKQLDPDKHGVNLVLHNVAGGDQPKITLSLAKIPLTEALRYVANLANYEIVASDAAILFKPIAK